MSDDEGEADDSGPRIHQRVAAGINRRLDQLLARDYISGAKAAVLGVVLIPLALLTPVVRALPGTWRLYHKLTKWAAYQMQKAASGHAIANVRRSNGKEDILPAAYVEGGGDEKGLSGWKIKGLGDKRYDPSVHGQTTARMGKADVIHVNEDDTEQASWAEATVDSAIQLDRERYLFRDATVNIEQWEYDVDAGQQAVADGGTAEPQATRFQQNVSVESPGVLSDVVVPLASRDGYDGQLVSWVQFQNTKQEQTDQESLRDAKNSAWAAAKLDDIEGADMLKWALIIGAWSAMLLFKDSIAAFIGGLSGGGGGGGAVGGALGMMQYLPALGVV